MNIHRTPETINGETYYPVPADDCSHCVAYDQKPSHNYGVRTKLCAALNVPGVSAACGHWYEVGVYQVIWLKGEEGLKAWTLKRME